MSVDTMEHSRYVLYRLARVTNHSNLLHFLVLELGTLGCRPRNITYLRWFGIEHERKRREDVSHGPDRDWQRRRLRHLRPIQEVSYHCPFQYKNI